MGIYFTQYDSKVPYIRYKGQRGIYAGDLFDFPISSSTTYSSVMDSTATGFGLTPVVENTPAETDGKNAVLLSLANMHMALEHGSIHEPIFGQPYLR